MPRIARIDTPGLLHHVMIRGIERRKIFNDDQDRENFIDRLSLLLPKTRTCCYAWSFLSNHAHFLLRSGPGGIAALMRRVLTGYAVSYNRRHKRHGQLFQNRYKSIVCQEDAYLLELVRYVHLNPLRTKAVVDVNELDGYPYCGHSAVLGKHKREWQDVEYILGFFGKRVSEARKRYVSYVKEGIALGRRPELVGGGLIRSLGGWDEVKKMRLSGQDRIKGDQRILGESDFVQDILAESEKHFSRKYKLKGLGYDFERAVEKVCTLFQVEKEFMTRRGKHRARVKARDVLCYWSVVELGMSMVDVARRCDMTPAAVGYAVQRGEKTARHQGYQLDQ